MTIETKGTSRTIYEAKGREVVEIHQELVATFITEERARAYAEAQNEVYAPAPTMQQAVTAEQYANGANGALASEPVAPAVIALTPMQTAVLETLKKHAGKTGYISMTGRDIAEDANINRTSVYGILKILRDNGHIKNGPNGSYQIA